MSVYSDFTFFHEGGETVGRSFVRRSETEDRFTRFFWTPGGRLEVREYDSSGTLIGGDLNYDTQSDVINSLTLHPPFDVPGATALSEEDDTANFGNEDNYIIAGDGNDVVNAGGGNNLVHGGEGNDTLTSISQSDIMFGNNGSDFVAGGSNNDYLMGGAGDDEVRGQKGDDVLSGGAGKRHN
jgi:Ca2+-binding RTX toxin-like protein